MLYQLHELQRKLLSPVTTFAESAASLYASPGSPLAYLPFAREISASYDLLHRLGKEYEKPEFGITDTVVRGQPVAVVEEAAITKPFCVLKHFKRQTRVRDPKVLVCAPLSGHHSTLLRDTVRQLVTAHDVYITDWVDARMVPLSSGAFRLDDYIAYLIEFIRHLGPDLHVISVCQPTVPALVAISLLAAENDPMSPLTMTMMGGPIDTRRNPTEVNALAIRKPFSWFENNVIYRVPHNYPGYMRRVYPGFLQHAGFVAMNPDRHLTSHWEYYNHLIEGDGESAAQHRAFYDEYNAVLDMDADYYLDTIRMVFQEHALPLGTWVTGETLGRRRVEPAAIRRTALFTIEGEIDDISGCGQTEAAHDLCTGIPKSRKQHFTAPKCGHYGIFSGRRWRELIYPRIAAFIRKHG
ncbi:MAG: polyhydroxyalkanoate depolymerase [Burkholderiales bacterium]|nr:polyhydroxyalkanoate depolymerase [Burkholderiales bacterium]